MSTAPKSERPTLAHVPVAWGHEDGDAWFAEGHWSDTAMLLAVVSSELMVGGLSSDELCGLLFEAQGPDLWKHTEWENAAKVNERCEQVARIWLRPDPDNEENMLPCDESHPDAHAWTEFRA